MDRCYICGTKLIETNGKKICPNCGIIEENKNESESKEARYIG